MQYPPAPREKWEKLEKLYDPAAAWEDVNRNLISGRRELRKMFEEGCFDLVLLMDYDARLFRFQNMGVLQKARNWLGQWNNFLQYSNAEFSQETEYMQGVPLALAEIRSRVPVAAVDFNDWTCLTPGDQKILQDSSFYFKRELPFNRYFLYYQKRPAPWSEWRKKLSQGLDKVHNIPLGIEDEKYFQLKKQRAETQDIDIFFCGEATSTPRLKAVQILQEMAASTSLNIVIDEKLPFEEYCEKTARSRITLSVSGGGWDCFRHYEAVALGSVPFIDRPTVDAAWWQHLPADIFFENTFENFRDLLEKLLNNEQRRETYLDQIEKQVEAHMLHSKIVEYIVHTSLGKSTGV